MRRKIFFLVVLIPLLFILGCSTKDKLSFVLIRPVGDLKKIPGSQMFFFEAVTLKDEFICAGKMPADISQANFFEKTYYSGQALVLFGRWSEKNMPVFYFIGYTTFDNFGEVMRKQQYKFKNI